MKLLQKVKLLMKIVNIIYTWTNTEFGLTQNLTRGEEGAIEINLKYNEIKLLLDSVIHMLHSIDITYIIS